MKHLLTLFLLLTTLPVFAQSSGRDANDTCWALAEKPKDVYSRVVLYRPGDYNSKNYRIPAIVTAGDGSLVVATDKRKYNDIDLPEDIDILVNRSTDGGRTWSEPLTLAEGTGVGHGFGDCALVRTNEEGGLIAVFAGGTIGLYVEEAYNDGVNYSMVFYNFSIEWLLEPIHK